MTRTMIDSDFPYVSSVSFFLLSLVIMECPAFAVLLSESEASTG